MVRIVRIAEVAARAVLIRDDFVPTQVHIPV